MATSNKKHILLTSLGMRAIETEYEWNGKKVTADLTPLALVQLLDKTQLPNHIVTVVTVGAKRETWQPFRAGICQTLKFSPEIVEIPDGNSSDEIRQILESVAKRIPEGSELTLDVTQGFRHFPFIFYALVLYLKSLRGVTIRGAYYGMIEGTPRDAPKPIIDLQPLLELPEWFHAVQMFRDQGTTKPMAQLLQPLADMLNAETSELFKRGDTEAGRKLSGQAKQIKNSVDWLKAYAFAYESALPLELGKASKGLMDSIKKSTTVDSVGLPPLFAELNESITTAAEKSAFEKRPSNAGDWKRKPPVVLNADELERQARMIDIYLDRDQLSLGVGLMREWVVSWAVCKSGNRPDIQEWLNLEVRERYTRRIGAIGAFARTPAFKTTITSKQKEFGQFWDQLGNALRNLLLHHAMRVDPVEERPKVLEKVRDFWNSLREDRTKLPLLGGSHGKLLISPQGTRPGVLFSALKVTHPADTCIVICSSASVSSITDAASHAAFAGKTEPIELVDPHGGFDEITQAVDQVRPHLLEADEVVANMTGGTTLMGIIVQQLVEEAQKLDRPVRRFVLIDRRPPAQQDRDPFVQSDCHWLDN
ncbi:MAG: TIGR02221 family CRISPR-associated protein [Candidatus Poribacteria bacterium]|nr:TIGR02221 family CRISPR-associated protein [Candidatus Poribacteria bacterium]